MKIIIATEKEYQKSQYILLPVFAVEIHKGEFCLMFGFWHTIRCLIIKK